MKLLCREFERACRPLKVHEGGCHRSPAGPCGQTTGPHLQGSGVPFGWRQPRSETSWMTRQPPVGSVCWPTDGDHWSPCCRTWKVRIKTCRTRSVNNRSFKATQNTSGAFLLDLLIPALFKPIEARYCSREFPIPTEEKIYIGVNGNTLLLSISKYGCIAIHFHFQSLKTLKMKNSVILYFKGVLQCLFQSQQFFMWCMITNLRSNVPP